MKKKKILTIGGISLGVVAIVAPLIASVSGAIKTSYQIAPYSDKGDRIGLNNYVYSKDISDLPTETDKVNPKANDTSKKDWRVDLYDHLVSTKTIKNEPKEINSTQDGKVWDIDPESIGTEIGIWASKGTEQSFEFTQWIDNQAPYMPFAQAGIDNKVYNVVKDGVLPVHGLNSPENYRDWISKNNPNERIKLTGAANPFKNTKVPLSVAFVDSPTSSYFQSILTALITWRTKYTEEQDGGYKATADMYLEGAKEITIKYATKNGSTSKPSDKKITITDGKINLEEAKSAMLENGGADSVEFTINNDLKWVNTKGDVQHSLSAKDFMAGLIAYYNSCELSFNANSYFFGLAGVNFKDTLTANNIQEVNDDKNSGHKKYNIDLMSDNKFVLKIGKTKNSSLLDILTKEYFFALPYKHPKTIEYIKPIKEYTIDNNGSNKIQVISNGKGGFSIDAQKTNWDELYGGGNQQENPDVWSSAAYRVSSSTLPETTLTRNDSYFQALNKSASGEKKDSKIWDENKTLKEIVLVTGGDNDPTSPEVTYDAFRSGTYDYAVVPSTRQLSAIGDYGGKGRDGKVLIEQPPSKAPQAQTINYNTNIWGPDGRRKDNITEIYENFVKKFNTDGKVIRQGINSMVNWVKLANLSFSNIGAYDYIQSIVPYGQLNGQYELMRKTSDKLEGSEHWKGGMPLTGATLQTFQNMKTSNDYDINNKVTQAIKPRFEKALDNIGATRERPLVLDFRTLHSVYSNGQIAYLQKLTNIIDGISNGRIRFNLISKTNKSLTDWYYNKNSPMGSFFWSPDYNDVGTWVGLYFEMKPGEPHQKSAGPKDKNEIYNGYQGAYGVATLWSQLYYELVQAKKNSMSNTTPTPKP